MSGDSYFRFGLRGLLISMAICAVIIAGIASIARNELSARFVVAKVRSLNGSVGKNYPPDKISFSLVGKRPLVADQDLEELAPYLGKFGVRSVGLANTRVSDSGLRSLIASCHDTLEVLSIHGSDISDKSLDVLSTCPNLQLIALSVSQLTDASIDELARIDALREISVYGARPEDEMLSRLKDAVRPSVIVHAYEKLIY